MVDARFFSWLFDYANRWDVAYVLLLLLALVAFLLIPGGAGGGDVPARELGSTSMNPYSDWRNVFNETTGAPLVTPYDIVDIDGNPRMPPLP